MRRLLPLLLVAGAVLGYRWIRVPLQPWLPATGSIAASPDPGALRLVTWNLRNFPDGHDQDRLRDVFDELRADVYGLQEVHDPSALSSVLPDHALVFSRDGGRHGQRLGVAYRRGRFEPIGEARQFDPLSLEGLVRPGFTVVLRDRHRPRVTFAVVVVHLKARPSGQELRRTQWLLLASWLRELRARWTNVVLLGDFNVTGGPSRSAADELRQLGDTLTPEGFRRIPVVGRCTAYWDGVRRDRWLEPSELDLGWISGFADYEPSQAVPGSHCARHRCRPFESSDGFPDPDFETLSDHCPVIFDFT